MLMNSAKFKMKYLNAKHRSWSCQYGLKWQSTAGNYYPTTILVLLIYFLQNETTLYSILSVYNKKINTHAKLVCLQNLASFKGWKEEGLSLLYRNFLILFNLHYCLFKFADWLTRSLVISSVWVTAASQFKGMHVAGLYKFKFIA